MPKVILELPPTTNHTYGQSGKRKFMYAEAKSWKEMAMYKFREYKGNEPTEIWISYFLKFRRDVDGCHKLILDSMQSRSEGIGVMKDDNSIMDLHLHKEMDSKNPRVEVSWN